MRISIFCFWTQITVLGLGCNLPKASQLNSVTRQLGSQHTHAALPFWSLPIFNGDEPEEALLIANETSEDGDSFSEDTPTEPLEEMDQISSNGNEHPYFTSSDSGDSDADADSLIAPTTNDHRVIAAQATAPLLPALMDETTLRREAARTESALNQILKRAGLAAWEHPEFERAIYNPDGLPIADIVRRRHEILRSLPQFSPVDGWISSTVGRRAVPGEAAQQIHKGVDIAATVGTTVHAPGDGVVRFAGPNSTYGNYIAIVHGYGVVTKFAHNAKLLVRAGDRVKTGDPIARVGESGRVRGAHLHYEVWVNDRYVDPLHFMPPVPALKSEQTHLAADQATP